MSHLLFPTDKPAGEMAERLRRVRYVISDADGTMFTGAKATVDSAGAPSPELVETLVELTRAGVSVIPCTGRNRSMIKEDARVLGMPGWIAEMGGVVCTRESSQPEWSYFTGDMPYDPACGKTPHDVICETGVIDDILERFRGHVETYHDNGIGFEYREVTVALRGDAPVEEMQDMLDACGLPLYLADNGLVPRISGATTLNCDLDHPVGMHTYHVTPVGVTKGTGIVRFVELAGLEPDEVMGAGDSPADCVIADHVGVFLFMMNGLDHPSADEELTARNNIYLSSRPSTDGWCQCMRALLAAKE
ncbi:MAG: HAD family phosphatase [Atopobiaceae bacterium]|jgi:hydroxymethylpyrimidine pyrophosphatase-like HAD family hydrolase|nr:HAD family phosphatase [Atopobiaceae bacterium]MCI2173880.1 HAD family phosphatase [Atopobiaceae bacterium]MCI2208030.1 HAD family phosphatase [Atopobiaceae bacterium]